MTSSASDLIVTEANPIPPSDPIPADKAPIVKEKVDWLAELRGLVLMLLGVLAFHSFIAKPFYIPSISMMPGCLMAAAPLASPMNREAISRLAAASGFSVLIARTVPSTEC